VRDFKYCYDYKNSTVSQYGETAILILTELFRTYHTYKAIADKGSQEAKDKYAELLAIKEKLIAHALTGPKSYDKPRALAKRFEDYQNEYFTFIDDLRVEPTNNFSERSLRHPVIYRKVCYGAQSQSGVEFCETIWTVFVNLKKQGLKINSWLIKTLTDFNEGKDLPSLVHPGQAVDPKYVEEAKEEVQKNLQFKKIEAAKNKAAEAKSPETKVKNNQPEEKAPEEKSVSQNESTSGTSATKENPAEEKPTPAKAKPPEPASEISITTEKPTEKKPTPAKAKPPEPDSETSVTTEKPTEEKPHLAKAKPPEPDSGASATKEMPTEEKAARYAINAKPPEAVPETSLGLKNRRDLNFKPPTVKNPKKVGIQASTACLRRPTPWSPTKRDQGSRTLSKSSGACPPGSYLSIQPDQNRS
jgi:hypothetical protein